MKRDARGRFVTVRKNPAETGFKVEDYVLRWKSGHHKICTRVTMPDGRRISFMDRLSKREAIKNAKDRFARGYEGD